MKIVFTSVANNYIPKARILAESLKKFHPDWYFILLINDKNLGNEYNYGDFFDEILNINELDIPNFNKWCFRYDVEEICTAAKPFAFLKIFEKYKPDFITFIDPDIKIFNKLIELEKILELNDIILTPHLASPETDKNLIVDNELSVLKHGIFNLGFLSVNNNENGNKFIQWWRERLYDFCLKDYNLGLWTDQKWINLAPCYFDKIFILKDAGYNVATWNASKRIISEKNSVFYVNDKLLRFYHFTGYDSGDGKIEVKKYLKFNPLLKKIWDQYDIDIKNSDIEASNKECIFSIFLNGEKINYSSRVQYRNNLKFYKDINPFKKNNEYFISDNLKKKSSNLYIRIKNFLRKKIKT
jgi:hypothetical protein